MDNQTSLEKLGEMVSQILGKYNSLKVENETLRTQVVTLRAENDIKTQEIEKLTEQNVMKELEIEEIVSQIESMVG